ncbi:hypothetical protein KIL84_006971, partial [Mauremys mutica]
FPSLRLLDLRWIEDVKDSHLRELLLPPTDSKPGCNRLTDQCLPLFRRCPRLSRVDLRSCRHVTPEGCARFCEDSGPPAPPPAGPPFRCPEEKLLIKDS